MIWVLLYWVVFVLCGTALFSVAVAYLFKKWKGYSFLKTLLTTYILTFLIQVVTLLLWLWSMRGLAS